ncbi:MAG: hypothetical protein AB7O88_28640 [Reyranellaceae bacterium]
MQNFLFKCSRVGLLVQGSVERSELPEPGALIAYECPACRGLHLVDPRQSHRPESDGPRET